MLIEQALLLMHKSVCDYCTPTSLPRSVADQLRPLIIQTHYLSYSGHHQLDLNRQSNLDCLGSGSCSNSIRPDLFLELFSSDISLEVSFLFFWNLPVIQFIWGNKLIRFGRSLSLSRFQEVNERRKALGGQIILLPFEGLAREMLGKENKTRSINLKRNDFLYITIWDLPRRNDSETFPTHYSTGFQPHFSTYANSTSGPGRVDHWVWSLNTTWRDNNASGQHRWSSALVLVDFHYIYT